MSPDLIPQTELNSIRSLYESGQYGDAWRHLEIFGKPEEWRDVETIILAGRIIGNLEAENRARALHSRAWRLNRRNGEAAYYRSYSIRSRLGPFRALRFLESLPEFPDATAEVRASLIAQRASLLGNFRDFTTAEKLYAEAEAIDGVSPWLLVERASMLERADRYDEALETVQRALEMRPFYRPAVQSAGHLLGLLNKDEEAIALLTEASKKLQSPDVVAQVATLLREHHRYDEALAMWRRYREFALLIEPAMVEYWHARMSDLFYDIGELAQAAEHGKLAKNGYHERIAERIAVPPAEGRICKLDVPFVRQHEMTCAPATLSAISHYWRAPVDHLALAQEICYDGTESHKERAWAEASGYVVREFTVTWDAAKQLLDLGIPFTVATVETTSAHLQSIVGYDSIRRTLYIRDPFRKSHSECISPGWLEDYAFCGPRGMALIPKDQVAKIEGVELPDANLMDELHALDRGLHTNNRPRAAEALAKLETLAPGHRILFQARRILAWYDGDQPRALAAIEELLKLFPDNNNLRWARYNALRDLSRKAEHRALLEEMARSKNAEPLFWRELGDEMRADAREHAMGRRWLLRVLRYQPSGAENLFSIASQLWDERRFADALPLYRLAAHLRDRVSYFQRAWFTAARHFHRADEVLAVMASRAKADGPISSAPALILYNALVTVDRTAEAFTILDEAITCRPTDGELLTFTADVHARHGRYEKSAELVARAEGKCPRINWLRSCATLADYRSDLRESLRLWREILAESPLAFDAIRTISRLTAEVEGRKAAYAFIAGQIGKFPHHIPLRELEAEWLRNEGPEAQEPSLLALLAMAPNNTWALRERAFALAKLQKHEAALAQADAAISAEPQEAANHYTRGRVLFLSGRLPEAAEAYRNAVLRSVDNSGAIDGLLATCVTFEEKKKALGFILTELETQVVFGDGLFNYHSAAFPILEPDELLQNLRQAHVARPDLWHAWSVLVSILCDAKRAVEALPIAKESVERFPLNARLWMDLARVYCEQRNFEEEVASLRRACELSPAWSRAARELSDALQRCGRYDEAERVLEEIVAAVPLDGVNRGYLADMKWRRRRDPRALTLVTEAIRLDPGYEWAWDTLRDWSDDPERAVAVARELTETRSGEATSWLRLASMLPDKLIDERLSYLDRATTIDPRFDDAHDARIRILSNAGRYDEAAAACSPPAYEGALPRGLRARSAWVKAERGNLLGAIAEMTALVEEQPDFFWAWQRLAQWNGAIGEHKAERDAAERMARLNPRNAVPLGYLAEAELKLGNRETALVVLERAFAIDPGYRYAAFTLFDAHLEKRETGKAKAKLEKMRVHLPGADTTAAEVRLCCSVNDATGAMQKFGELVTVSERDDDAVQTAGRAIRDAGWARKLEKFIEPLLSDPTTNAQAGDEWVRAIAMRRAWGKRRLIWKLAPERKLTRTVWETFITVCGEKKELRFVKEMIKRFRTELRSDDALWGAVGYALSACDEDRDTIAWMSDWQKRPGVRPWMLTNFAASSRVCERFDDAMAAHQHALTLRHDHTYPQHILWLAIPEIVARDYPAARNRMNELRRDALDSFCKTLWALCDVVCKVHESTPEERRKTYSDGMKRLGRTNHKQLKQDRFLRAISQRLVTRMAREAGLMAPRFRGWWFAFIDLY